MRYFILFVIIKIMIRKTSNLQKLKYLKNIKAALADSSEINRNQYCN